MSVGGVGSNNNSGGTTGVFLECDGASVKKVWGVIQWSGVFTSHDVLLTSEAVGGVDRGSGEERVEK